MNSVVCLKQVPDTESQIKIAPDGRSIVTDNIKWVMNPYDEYAVEEALRLKEKCGGEVTIIGVGPKRVTESIRTALAMGADRGILVDDPAVADTDPLSTARVLKAVRKVARKSWDDVVAIVIPDPMAWVVQSLLSGEELSGLWNAETDSGRWELIEPVVMA